jgi:hypothetical protein
MKSRWVGGVAALLAAFVLEGCDGQVGGPIPPSKGGDEARKGIEYPFGTPKNLKNFKPKKGVENVPEKKFVH